MDKLSVHPVCSYFDIMESDYLVHGKMNFILIPFTFFHLSVKLHNSDLVSSFCENHWDTSEECAMAIQCSCDLVYPIRAQKTPDGINQAALLEPPQATLALEANMPILPFPFEDWLPPASFREAEHFMMTIPAMTFWDLGGWLERWTDAFPAKQNSAVEIHASFLG